MPEPASRTPSADAAAPPPSRLGRHRGKLTAAVAAVCLVLIARILWRQDWAAVFAAVRAHDAATVLPALGLIVASFIALSGYDLLGLRLAGCPLPPIRTVLKAAFVGTVFAMNFGFTALSGSAVRAFYYGRAGIGPGRIAAMLGWMALSFGLGWLALFGIALAAWPSAELAGSMGLPIPWQRALGLAMLAAAGAYLLACARRWKVSLGRFSWSPPPLRLALAQLGVSVIDGCLAGAVLYVLLPVGGIPFPAFMGAFLTAVFAGMASHVPGGFGVIEVTLLHLLGAASGSPAAADILAGMIVYRVLNFLLPLLPAGLLFLADMRRFAARKP